MNNIREVRVQTAHLGRPEVEHGDATSSIHARAVTRKRVCGTTNRDSDTCAPESPTLISTSETNYLRPSIDYIQRQQLPSRNHLVGEHLVRTDALTERNIDLLRERRPLMRNTRKRAKSLIKLRVQAANHLSYEYRLCHDFGSTGGAGL